MQMNKQGTLSCRNVLFFLGHYQNIQLKTQMIALRLMHALLIYHPPLCISIMLVTSLNDITIICFPFLAGKTLCMCRRAALAHLCICQHPCWPTLVFSTAMHGPYHQFHIPDFEPVTLSPGYFSVPSYQSLKFIKNRLKWLCTKNGRERNMIWNEHNWQLYKLRLWITMPCRWEVDTNNIQLV